MKAGLPALTLLVLLAACATAVALDGAPTPAEEAVPLRSYRWVANPCSEASRARAAVDAQLVAKGWKPVGRDARFELVASACPPAAATFELALVDASSHQRLWRGDIPLPADAQAARVDHEVHRLFAAFPMTASTR